MPWMRNGDNAATYPPLMSVRADRRSDERTVNEVAGWLWRCSTQAAGHLTDYTVDVGTAEMFGGARTAELVRLCKKTGLLTEERRGGIPVYVIVDDPEFIHMRLRQEVMWERQQRNDTRDPRLRVPVLRRDGDNCRWCGVLVQWLGRKSNRTGTLDHEVPGEAGTPDTMFVACLGCNSARMDNVEVWDADHDLRLPPATPNYSAKTAKYLTTNGYPTKQNVRNEDDSDRQHPAPAAAADTAPDGVRSAAPRIAGAAPGARTPANATGKSKSKVDGTASAGSGRVGSVSGSSPAPPPSEETQPPARARPRSRRGRRGGRRSPPPGLCPAHHLPEPCLRCQHEYDTEGDTR
ncbi:hypothetical protein ACTHAM_002368 [Cellulomonas soli]|uniref:hypothetical protein n=1 Tax=Cellulomonas soli TaxID=931535 RepID=UPI003F84F31A